jgi:5'-nucleotidase
MMKSRSSIFSSLCLALLCTWNAAAWADATEISIFSINDFHGHLEASKEPPQTGGVAYLSSVLNDLRSQRAHSVLVGGGDLIGASPAISALLHDEPTLAAMEHLGMVATALGNHDLDAGFAELQRKLATLRFPYLAANMFDAATGKRLLPSHTLQKIGGVRVAFVGAVTKDVPKVTVAKSIKGLRFTDEAEALNALVPELRASGAQVLIAIVHDGAYFEGDQRLPNDSTYACPGLKGRAVEIAKRIDPAYAVVISAHTHQAYTCKINGRLLVQGGSSGHWITESRLVLEVQNDNVHITESHAVNHPVRHAGRTPDPVLAALVEKTAIQTAAQRNQPIISITRSITRAIREGFGDSELGNLIADAQLAYAQKRNAEETPIDIAFTNAGGIRADFIAKPQPTATTSNTATNSTTITQSDVFTIQPFNNDLIALTLTGAELQQVIERQPARRQGGSLLQVSHTLRIAGDAITVHGKPLELERDYRIVVNQFMADGGNDLSTFKKGRDRQIIGNDLEALEEYLRDNPKALQGIERGRIVGR